MPVHGSRLYPASQAVCAYNRRQDTGKLKALPRGLQDEADKALAQGLRPFDELVNRVPAEVRELAQLKSQKFKDHVRTRLKECIQALLPAIVELADAFEIGNLSKDIRREELERALR